MAKEIKAMIKLQIEAGKANPAPPVGPALGQHGINIQDFCKKYNDATKDKMGMVIPVIISVYMDRSFSFVTKTPPAADLIKKTLKLKSGSPEPNKIKVGKLTRAQAEEIAKIKMPDLNAFDLDAAVEVIYGTARSMGIDRA